MMGCLIAGTNCTYRNGATAVIPGSHLWGPDRAPKVEEVTYAEMAPGSALFTLGSTYHGAGENKCEPGEPDALRTLFAVFGQRDTVRPDQEEILTTPIEIARQLPDDILRIAGYCEFNGDRADGQTRLCRALGTSRTTRAPSTTSTAPTAWASSALRPRQLENRGLVFRKPRVNSLIAHC